MDEFVGTCDDDDEYYPNHDHGDDDDTLAHHAVLHARGLLYRSILLLKTNELWYIKRVIKLSCLICFLRYFLRKQIRTTPSCMRMASSPETYFSQGKANHFYMKGMIKLPCSIPFLNFPMGKHCLFAPHRLACAWPPLPKLIFPKEKQSILHKTGDQAVVLDRFVYFS